MNMLGFLLFNSLRQATTMSLPASASRSQMALGDMAICSLPRSSQKIRSISTFLLNCGKYSLHHS